MIDQWWLLLAIGLTVGAFGALLGVGGGFILVPVLILLMPTSSASDLTSISLAVVFLSAASGTVAYVKMKRVDLKSAKRFALATLPGAILGAAGTRWFPRQQFNMIFGALLLVGAFYLLLRPGKEVDPEAEPAPHLTKRELVDARGTKYIYHFSMPVGISISVVVGFVSSLFGIGGGIIHVPVLNRTLNFPAHVATATSQATLCLMAFAGTLVHVAQGSLNGQWARVAVLGVGAIVGAQGGARVSSLFAGSLLIRALALTLGVVALRILWTSLG